jgi:hypothetical protein
MGEHNFNARGEVIRGGWSVQPSAALQLGLHLCSNATSVVTNMGVPGKPLLLQEGAISLGLTSLLWLQQAFRHGLLLQLSSQQAAASDVRLSCCRFAALTALGLMHTACTCVAATA